MATTKEKRQAKAKAAKDETIQALADGFVASLLEALETGDLGTWQRPWSVARPMNPVSGHMFTGNNWLICAMGGIRHAATYRQWQSIGGQVRRNEKPFKLLKPTPIKFEDPDTGEEKRFVRFSAISYFDIGQVELPEDIQAKLETKVSTQLDEMTPTEAEAEAKLAKVCRMVTGGDNACYRPTEDVIWMPERTHFKSNAAYLGTYAHETVHATGAEHRLGRPGITNFDGFGTEQYAAEELIAELGAGMLSATLGVDHDIRNDHGPYIAHWVKAITDDASALTTAIGQAKVAVDYILAD